MLVPYEIETLLDERPYANWELIGITSAVSLLALAMVSADEVPAWVDALVLDGWNPVGLLGHTLLHGDFMHLAGNMLFLFVFGNAICCNAGPRFRSLLEIFTNNSGEQRKDQAKFARLMAGQEEE